MNKDTDFVLMTRETFDKMLKGAVPQTKELKKELTQLNKDFRLAPLTMDEKRAAVRVATEFTRKYMGQTIYLKDDFRAYRVEQTVPHKRNKVAVSAWWLGMKVGKIYINVKDVDLAAVYREWVQSASNH